MYRFDPATGGYHAFEVDRPVTAVARRASGGWLVAAPQPGMALAKKRRISSPWRATCSA
jgi:hypothetical protein